MTTPFNSRFRDECLNENLFRHLARARYVIALWVHDYNYVRPHSALRYLTPDAYAAALQSKRDDALEGLEGPANHQVDQPAQMRKIQPVALDQFG